MQRSTGLRFSCSAALAVALLAPALAAADVFSLYAAVQGGGAGGKGVDGEAQDEAFHSGVQGLAYGALVGVELLFVDGWVEHTQHMRDGALAGTWTQFMIGLDTRIDLGEPETVLVRDQRAEQAAQEQAAQEQAAQEQAAQEQAAQEQAAQEPDGQQAASEQGAQEQDEPPAGEQPAGEQAVHGQRAAPAAPARPAAQPVAQRRPVPGTAPGYLDLGFAAGFGVGTGQQVMPPLDNSELTDKGFLGQVHVGLGYRLARALSVGVRVPVQAGYLFKSGDGAAANDRGNQYVSVNAAVLLELRLELAVR
jgi:pyruvate/2-oxoglutarate dehydrogenase complex dihydrolipoamide acyltransferase (E2) component